MRRIWAWLTAPARILVSGFAVVILLGAFLLTLPVATQDGQGLPFVDALFEATSAVCVTGLVVVDTATTFTIFGQIVLLSLIQVGGLGFMTMTAYIFVLLGRKIGLKERILIRESLNQWSLQGMVKLARYVLLTTLLIEGIGAILIAFFLHERFGWGQALWYGIFHGISSFCNAGFDLFGNFSSLTSEVGNWGLNLTVMTLITIGGLGFAVIAEIHRGKHRRWKQLSLHSKMVFAISATLVLIGTVVIYLLEYSNPFTLRPLSWDARILASLFQAVTPRTAGFNTLDLSHIRPTTVIILLMLMFIGASPGSTGGGIKTTTFGALAAAVWSVVRGKTEVEIFDRRLGQEIIYRAMAITALAISVISLVSMILTVTEAADYLTVLFETVSAFGTVGLTLGLTPKLSMAGKLLITMTMFIGRLGPLTMFMALAQMEKPSLIRHPEEKILVG